MIVAAIEFRGARERSSVKRQDEDRPEGTGVRSDMEFWRAVRREVLTGRLTRRAGEQGRSMVCDGLQIE